MLVTPEINRHNRRHALTVSIFLGVVSLLAGWAYLPLLGLLVLAPIAYWFLRRQCLRRMAIAQRPFPPQWQTTLETRVRFYRALDEDQKERFRQMVSVFLEEVRITGVRTDIDDTIRVLVGASAVIPIFGFSNWEYHRLGEVLVYPGSFDHDYHNDKPADANILGLTGLGYLRGVVILSKPSLLEAFTDSPNPENVGVHEFTHLVEQEEIDEGLPSEIPEELVREWVKFVARELAHPSNQRAGINDYAYTNEHEFLAVLSEYFFGAPEALKAKAPALYELLHHLFHQDPAALTSHLPRIRRRLGRNDLCPCGSGKKYKDCCLHVPAA